MADHGEGAGAAGARGGRPRVDVRSSGHVDSRFAATPDRPAFEAARHGHVDLQRHVRAGGRAPRRQPRPGVPRLSDRSGADRSRHRGHARRPQPVSAVCRRPCAARSDRRQGRAAVRARLRSRARSDGDHRRDAGDLHVDPGARASGRRGDPVRARVRQLHPGHPDGRRHARAAAADGSRLPDRFRRARTRDHAAHARDHAEHAEQSGTERADRGRSRRAGGRRRATRRSWSSATRCTSTWCSTAQPHCSLAAARGARGAQRGHRLVRQDVPRHRLEGRLRAGAAGDHRGDPPRPPVHGIHRQQRRAARARGVPRRSVALRDAAGLLLRQARPAALDARELRRSTLLPCAGSYFQLATYERISDEPAAAFAQRLVREIGVATIPLSAFYQDGTDHRVIRFCFAKRDETLRAAGERLTQLRAR